MIEAIYASLWTLGTGLLPSLGRGLIGWTMTSFSNDGKIDKFEAQKLVETVVSNVVITAGIVYGFPGLFGIDVSALSAAIGVATIDFFVSFIAKKFKTTVKKK